MLLALADWFLPTSVANGDPSALRRVRLTMAVGFFSGCGVSATLVVATEHPDSTTLRALTYSLAILLIAVPAIVKAGVPIRAIQHAIIALLVGYSLTLVGATGGIDSGGFFVALLTPLYAIVLLGGRAGLGWTAILGLALAAIGFAVLHGYDAPVHPNPSEVARWAFWGCLAGMGAVMAAALTYETLQANTLRRLVDAIAIAEREHARRLALESHFRESLQAQVERRTAELARSREQLRQADRLASIGTLAAGVAHQINNPVGSILLGAEVTLATIEPEDRENDRAYREALRRTIADARRCGDIVRSLLRFSRSELQARGPIDLNDVTRTAIGTIHDASDHVDLVLSPLPLPIQGNAIEIEQVIVNIASNALQSGARNVRVATRRIGTEAHIEIRDDGPGIPEAHHAQIFDPFFTTRTREGGTGLGLSVVHGIVTDHAGRITVESDVGRGSLFVVVLPLDDATSRATTRSTPKPRLVDDRDAARSAAVS
ncbi:MAG TPA: ATP-binding protein [Myxococcota bacterium]|nr:ATP-binding protein [Myxococcota bacterium]